MAYLWHELAQILEEWDVVRNRVTVRQHPVRIVQVEVDEAGHIVPSTKIQPNQMIAQVVCELLHLKCQRVRFHQRHALDVVVRQPAPLCQRLKQISPPACFFRGLGFRDVEAQRMFQLCNVDAIENPANIKQRGRG